MKILSLFSGIGAFERALTNIGVDYELVGFSEIDKWAIESYAAIHDVTVDKNLGDVSEIAEEDLPDADMVTYGFPCQDVSVAGQGAGIKEGTRSGLLYEAERIIEHVKPKYAIAENVKNLIGKRHREDFELLLERLEGCGYNNYWEVLNSKEFGIPQNRERVFIVSIRKDVDDGSFEFPQGYDSGIRLKDMLLEGEVEDKYYIENERTKKLLGELETSTERQVVEQRIDEGFRFFQGDNVGTIRTIDAGGDKRVLEPVIAASRGRNTNKKGEETQQRLEVNEQGTTNTLTTVQKDNWVLEPNSIKKVGSINSSQDGVVVDPNGVSPTHTAGNGNMPKVTESNDLKLHKNLSGGKWDKVNESTRRVYDEVGIAPTVTTAQGGNTEPKVHTNYRIRKLTPQECWRLMGFEDEDYWTARRRLEEKFYNGGDRSNSQMYKQAGNSIVVDVLERLFENLLN